LFHASSQQRFTGTADEKGTINPEQAIDWLRVRTNQNRLERLKKIKDENEGKEKPESSDFN